jgi:hypothetical protein
LNIRLTIFVIFIFTRLSSQTLGGNSVFNFLNVPHSPQLTALGGVNVSQPSNDIGLAFNNPALLRESMHAQLHTVFNSFYAGTSIYHVSLGYRHEKLKTNFIWGLHYFSYGNTSETDASGNILGSFRPTDWVMQVGASRSYLEKWNYGAAIKFISSNYGQYRSSGVAMDAGVVFRDSSRSLSAAILVKNLGFQIKTYYGTQKDDLPFDLQIGITKKLKHAPFGFSLTARKIHLGNIRYNDEAFNDENGFPNNNKGFTLGKLLDHLVIATSIYPGDHVEVTAGYNFLRRSDLNIGEAGNGLNGFSLGVGVLLGKWQIRYARAYYQSNTAYNQFGLNLKLNEFFGLGKFGQKIGW